MFFGHIRSSSLIQQPLHQPRFVLLTKHNKMEKQPLTNLGIATLIANLYALSQEDLQIEIDSIAMNFDSWLISHIILNPSQESYLINLPLLLKNQLKDKLTESLTNRNSIVFTKDETNSNKEGRGKLFGVDQINNSRYSEDLGVIIDSTLYVSISYSI